MDVQRLAGLVIIVGFVVFWTGNVYSPSGVYGETAVAARLEVVAQNPLRWALSQGMGGLGYIMILLGFILWSISLLGRINPGLIAIPAVIHLIAATLVAIYLYQYITDPAAVWENVHPSLFQQFVPALVWAAALLYGLLFLQAGLPAWLSYLMIGFGAIAVAAQFLFQPPAFYVISLYSLIALAAGIVLVRQ